MLLDEWSESTGEVCWGVGCFWLLSSGASCWGSQCTIGKTYGCANAPNDGMCGASATNLSRDVKQWTCFFGVACCELLRYVVLSEVCWSWLLWSIQRVCLSVSWYHYTPRVFLAQRHHFHWQVWQSHRLWPGEEQMWTRICTQKCWLWAAAWKLEMLVSISNQKIAVGKDGISLLLLRLMVLTSYFTTKKDWQRGKYAKPSFSKIQTLGFDNAGVVSRLDDCTPDTWGNSIITTSVEVTDRCI